MNVERRRSGAQTLGQTAFDELERCLLVERRYAAATDSLLAALRAAPTLQGVWSLVLQVFTELGRARAARLWVNSPGGSAPYSALGVSSTVFVDLNRRRTERARQAAG